MGRRPGPPPVRRPVPPPSLTLDSIGGKAVDASRFGPGDTCAICLGELCAPVDRGGSCYEGATPTSAARATSSANNGRGGQAGGSRTAPVVVVQAAPPDEPAAQSSPETETTAVGESGPASAGAQASGESGPTAPPEDRQRPRQRTRRCNRASAAPWPPLVSLQCEHAFHGQCIHEWLAYKGEGATCPLCKQSLLSGSALQVAQV